MFTANRQKYESHLCALCSKSSMECNLSNSVVDIQVLSVGDLFDGVIAGLGSADITKIDIEKRIWVPWNHDTFSLGARHKPIQELCMELDPRPHPERDPTIFRVTKIFPDETDKNLIWLIFADLLPL